MKFSLDKKDQYAIFNLMEENLNSLVAPQLKSEFIFLHQEGTRNLIFDMTGVKFVDSSGLSAILTAHRIWKDIGVFIIAGKLQPAVTKLIEISRLDTILVVIPSISEAVDYVIMNELERDLNAE